MEGFGYGFGFSFGYHKGLGSVASDTVAVLVCALALNPPPRLILVGKLKETFLYYTCLYNENL